MSKYQYSENETSVSLTWNKVADRIDHLISANKFLMETDYAEMDEFERKRMSRMVIGFYDRLPNSIAKPFADDFFGEKAMKELPEILKSKKKKSGLLRQMETAWMDIPKDQNHLNLKRTVLDTFRSYVNGKFAIFPREEKNSYIQMSLFDFMGAS